MQRTGLKKRVDSREGKVIYAYRMSVVELVFGKPMGHRSAVGCENFAQKSLQIVDNELKYCKRHQ